MQYVPALTGLRAVACLMVVGFHSHFSPLGGGYVGVDIFFVLSGFLTVSILSSADLSRPWHVIHDFMARRAARIMPLLIFVSLCVTGWLMLTGNSAALTNELLPAIGLIANISLSGGTFPDVLVHTWTLAAEMQFYLLAAMLMVVLSVVAKWAALCLFAAIYVCLTGMSMAALLLDWGWHRVYYGPDMRASGLFLGGAVALLPQHAARGLGRALPALAWIAFALCILAAHQAAWRSAASFAVWRPVTELASATLILTLLSLREGVLVRALAHRVAQRIGILSFGIYLWHYPIALTLRQHLDGGITFALTLLITFPLAVASFNLIEQRFWRAKPAPDPATPKTVARA